jgi:CRP-like cAMP-binding protein
MNIADLFDSSDFFRAALPAAKKAIAEICIPKVLRKREFLFHEGDRGSAMYLMAQGVVQVFKTSADGREVPIKLLGPGEILGEVVLFERDTFPASAVALTATEVFLIPKKQLQCLLEGEAFRNGFISMLLAKQRYLTDQIFSLTALDAEERLFRFLRQTYGERDEYGVDISKKDAAAAIGVLPETLSRLLLKLGGEGVLRWDGETIRLSPGFWQGRKRRAPDA